MSVKFQPEVKQSFKTGKLQLAEGIKKGFTEVVLDVLGVCILTVSQKKSNNKQRKCVTSYNQGIHRSVILLFFRLGAEKLIVGS